MDKFEKENKRQSDSAPALPIKTYKWEDIKRARQKGGYPWTYLDKEAFNELKNPESFKMDTMKKNKTSSASSASDSLDIKEITEDDIKGLEGMDSSYVVIESPILLGRPIDEFVKEPEGIVESADSSDNISQYLDKEESGPNQQRESTETLTLTVLSEEKKKQGTIDRARSEEPKQKRRSSIESNYSRISLSNLGVMKRLRNAKGNLKLPKFGNKIKKKKETNKETTEKQTGEPIKERTSTKNEKPLYIHIPLKPPEGEKDEFSYLEFEEKKLTIPPEVQIQITEEDSTEKNGDTISEGDEQKSEVITNMNNLQLKPSDDQEDDVSAIIFLEGEEGCDDKGEYDIIAVDIDENSKEMTMSQITNTEVKRQVLDSIKKVESQTDMSRNNDGSGVPLSRSSSKASRTSKASIRKRRAKSVECENKRRGSIDSSYSRKSMSKLGLMKKLKQFHIPFIKSQSQKSITETTPEKREIELPKTTSKREVPGKDQKPVYIHIPLKLPEGQTDEFSHLESNGPPPLQITTQKSDIIEPEEQDMSPIDTPQVSTSPQYIILTPPSDDELLDKMESPEAQESDVIPQFEESQVIQKIDVERINTTSESIERADESVTQEQVDAADIQGRENKENTQTNGNLTIDEEDGLKSMSQVNEDVKSNLKSNLKNESSPLPKKKVSFKRRKSSQVSKDDGYEEIESPGETKVPAKPTEESSSTVFQTETKDAALVQKNEPENEETTDLNDLKENRWSKISDHEYEPINAPPETQKESTPLKSHVSEVLNPSSRHGYSDDEINSREIDTSIDNENNSFSRQRSSRSRSKEKDPAKQGRFQTAIKEGATKFKTKLQEIRKPSISISKPKFQKPVFKKPNINLPKMPDISFRRTPKKEVAQENENLGAEESSSKGIFDFSTVPRIFGKKKRDPDSSSLKESYKEKPEKPTKTTRSSGVVESIRIPLHSEESMDQENGIFPQPEEILEVSQIETKEEISPHRYQEDIEADDEDAIQEERQEKHRESDGVEIELENSRWNHGSFYTPQNGIEQTNDDEAQLASVEGLSFKNYDKEQMQSEMVTDLDLPEEGQVPFISVGKSKLQQNDSFDTNQSKVGSSASSLGQHRRGVLEEIDSDQFFLREKGISQDNIDMGKYLSTEIREAFRSPTNALADIHSYNYEEIRSSNQSLPETKRKQVKKPKRRKTPHTSQERIRYEHESENEDYNFMPPIRPKRKSRRKKRVEPEMEPIPYVESIDVEEIKNTSDREDDFSRQYENDRLEDMEVEHYNRRNLQVMDLHEAHRRASEPIPAAPARKHKSLKSLNASEHDSIFEQYGRNENDITMERYGNNNASIPDMEQMEEQITSDLRQEMSQAPKPPTRSRSKTRSMSRTTSQADRDSILGRIDSIMFDEELREPVVEEPCIKDLRDAMGYAIVDKNQAKNWEHKFCTVPRSQGSKNPPERPLRNYSTLGPSRPERKLSRNMTDEEKENIDLSQYIEIEDERDLQSGEVIQKIQNRPLPPPPRPPRNKSKPLSDITTNSNIDIVAAAESSEQKDPIDEMEVSTQTEPLPADFECEEMVHEETDKIMTPSALRKNTEHISEIHMSYMTDEDPLVFDAPSEHTYEEETITHGQLLVEPLNGTKILPDSEMYHEKSDEEETSEIPESFKKLSDPPIQTETKNISDISEDIQVSSNRKHEIDFETMESEMNIYTQKEKKEQQKTEVEADQTHSSESQQGLEEEQNIQTVDEEPKRPPRTYSQSSFDVLKAQKLQVSDLDVDRLTVNELVATKIIVSEIESENVVSNEITSKSGKLKLTDIELDPEIVRKLLEQLQDTSNQQQRTKPEQEEADHNDESLEQKKTPINFHDLETSLSQGETVTVTNSPQICEIPTDTQNTTNSEKQCITYSESANQNLEEFDTSTNNFTDSCKVSSEEIVDNSISPHTYQLNILEEDSNITSSIQGTEMNELIVTLHNERTNEEPKTIEEEIASLLNITSQTVQEPLSSEEVRITDVERNGDASSEEPPLRPPRLSEKKTNVSEHSTFENECNQEIFSLQTTIEERINPPCPLQLFEPEVDDEPPPRPPQPQIPYVPSEPPGEFFNLRAQHESVDNIPFAPRRHRHHRLTTVSRSSSSESSNLRISRRRIRSPEPSLSQLAGQFVSACGIVTRNKLKRLIDEINSKIPNDGDPESNKQNIQVIMVVLLLLITILLLMGYGDGRTVHLHHWEYFNPPTDV